MKKIVLVTMIYKSPSFLDFIIDQIKRLGLTEIVPGHEIDYLVIANDASPVIKQKLIDDNIKHLVVDHDDPNEYYLNRVYDAWNKGGFAADGDVIVFLNSDMGFSKGWLRNLIAQLDENTIPCSRLVESGKLPSGHHSCISKNFGVTPQTYQEEAFIEFADIHKKVIATESIAGGMFMPVAFFKSDFVASGGFPCGNIYEVPGDITRDMKHVIGAYGNKFYMSGDAYFFYHNPVMKNKEHITAMRSVVYHYQEGELDE